MISTIFATLWYLTKTALWVGFWLTIIAGLFALFHPIRVDLKLRASLFGQRAEFWFWYFFGIFGIGTVASRRNQFLVLQFGKWQWRLWQSRKKEKPQKPESGGSKAERPPTAESRPIVPDTQPVWSTPSMPAHPPATTTGAPLPPEKLEPSSAPASLASSPSPETPSTRPAATPTMSLSAETPPKQPESHPAKDAPEEVVPSPSTLPATIPFTMVEEEEPAPRKAETGPADAEPPLSGEKPRASGFGATLLHWRKKLARTLSMLKKVFLKGRAIWRRFSPMGKTLVFDLWQSLWILGPQARIRYGFGEPFLVGMTQGVAATVGGMLYPWGILIECHPIFDADTILVRGKAGLRFLPYKAVWGVARLLTERDLWRGLYDLWKWYRSRKK